MQRQRGTMRVAGWVAAVTATFALAACGSSGSTLSPADNFVIDCAAASTAIGDYGTDLQALITALTASDATAANSSADAFADSAKQVADTLPGLPPQAQGFLQVSQTFADKVKDAVASKGDLPPLSEDAKTTFASEDFRTGADAIEAFFRQQCPAQAATQG